MAPCRVSQDFPRSKPWRQAQSLRFETIDSAAQRLCPETWPRTQVGGTMNWVIFA